MHTWTAILTDSEYSHSAWVQYARNAGGLEPNLCIPLLVDRDMRVARDCGCLIEDKGITLRASYLIDRRACSGFSLVRRLIYRLLTDELPSRNLGKMTMSDRIVCRRGAASCTFRFTACLFFMVVRWGVDVM